LFLKIYYCGCFDAVAVVVVVVVVRTFVNNHVAVAFVAFGGVDVVGLRNLVELK